jgi:hypothetical protein
MKGSGYIARGVRRQQHSWLKHGKPRNDQELKELTVSQCQTMAPQLVGKPIRFEHQKHAFGVISGSKFDQATGDWAIEFDVPHADKYTPEMIRMIIDKLQWQGLSLTHPMHTQGELAGQLAGEPVEVSICEIPAREGCYVTKFNNVEYNTNNQRELLEGQTRGYDIIQASLNNMSDGKDTKMDTSSGSGSTAAFSTTPGMTPPAMAGSKGNGRIAMDTNSSNLAEELKPVFESATPEMKAAMIKMAQHFNKNVDTALAAKEAKEKELREARKKLAQADDLTRKQFEIAGKLMEKILMDTGAHRELKSHRERADADPAYRQKITDFAATPEGYEVLVKASMVIDSRKSSSSFAPQAPPQQQQQPELDEFKQLTRELMYRDVEVPQQNRAVAEVSASRGGGDFSSGRFVPPGPTSKQAFEDLLIEMQCKNLDKVKDVGQNIADIYDPDAEDADHSSPMTQWVQASRGGGDSSSSSSNQHGTKRRRVDNNNGYVRPVHDGE